MYEYGSLIAGQWRKGEGGDFETRNPARPNDIVGRYGAASTVQVAAAVAAARDAQVGWRNVPSVERGAIVGRFIAALEAKSEELARSITVEQGKPLAEARGETAKSCGEARFMMGEAARGHSEVLPSARLGIRNMVVRRPRGVIAAITPWNFPIHQMVAKVAAALGAGCAIVLKPSETAPGAADLLMRAVEAAAIPPGLVNLVWGAADIGDHLVTHPRVDKVSFTGSTDVGRAIMAAAARTLKPVTLELGGKSAAVLLDDADLDAALPVVLRMCLANSGQACVSQSRLIAPRAWIPAIVERFEASIAGWPLGDPHDPDTRLGPLATEAQFDRVGRMIDRAKSQGAQLRIGGAGRPSPFTRGWYVAPTLFTDVSPAMEIAQQEVFGPVLAVIGYDDPGEALELANATAYGLSGAVWSADAARATRFARGMNTGQVVINGAAQNLATPFGGWNASGFGHENGRFGIEDLLNYRALHGAA